VQRRDCLTLLSAPCWPVLDALAASGAGPVIHASERLFGSFADVILPATSTTSAQALAEVYAGWRRMNHEWNAWKGGELGRLNRALAAGRSAPASAPLRRLIEHGAELEQASDGLFNPAIGAVVAGWGFHADDLDAAGEALPRAAQRQAWRAARPSLSQLVWRGRELSCRQPGMRIDLGGIAKGAAADWALARLRARSIDHAVVNLGGNVAVMGAGPTGPWRIGIRDPLVDDHAPGAAAAGGRVPRSEPGTPATGSSSHAEARAPADFHAPADSRAPAYSRATGGAAAVLASLLAQPREAIVTSGQYERWRLVGGERVGHIIDPASMAPAPGLLSVTVAHPDATLADAAATALLVAGPERWPAIAARLGVDQVLVLDHHGGGAATARLAARLDMVDPRRRDSLRVV
jgi:thiamine biosynthesis lipoprotein